MMSPIRKRNARRPFARTLTAKLVTATAVALAVAGCRPGEDNGARVAGWSLVDPTSRHPIMVSQQPSTLSLKIARGAYGLSPHQRAQVVSFLDRYRSTDAGNSKLVIEAPSGSANEVSAMQAVAEIRHLTSESGFDHTAISVEAYHASHDQQAPIRVSYLRFVAEGPQCGHWPTNLADDPRNIPYPNMGCATQRNFAAQIANPADLVGPRSMTPTPGERRDSVWTKYVKGDSTVAKKADEEKVKVQGAN